VWYSALKVQVNTYGQPMFINANRGISAGVDARRGGTWKMFQYKSGKWIRDGTFDAELKNKNKIGD
jgi:hypothetical protein